MFALNSLFGTRLPVIVCLHLLPLPSAPLYGGSIRPIYDKAIEEATILLENGVNGFIIENFRDMPFYPERVPVETVAALAGVGHEIKRRYNCLRPCVFTLLYAQDSSVGKVGFAMLGHDRLRACHRP